MTQEAGDVSVRRQAGSEPQQGGLREGRKGHGVLKNKSTSENARAHRASFYTDAYFRSSVDVTAYSRNESKRRTLHVK